MEYYIRFGLWPKDERSHIGEAFRRQRAWVYNAIGQSQEEFEAGVSVYPAKWDDTKKRWVIPTFAIDSYIMSLDELISRKTDIYLVTGDEQDEEGSDGEPLLRNVKLVKKLDYCNIYNDHCYDEEAIISDEPSSVGLHQIDYIFKEPKKAARVVRDALSSENISKQIGHIQMFPILAGGIVLLVKELDYPGQDKRFNLFWPSLGPITGPVIVTALRNKQEIAESYKQYPWPWNLALEQEDISGPAGEEYRSLSKQESSKILKFLRLASKIR